MRGDIVRKIVSFTAQGPLLESNCVFPLSEELTQHVLLSNFSGGVD
jgi:hypothetical protein